MSGPLILGIDQGTSSTKCLLVDAGGAVIAAGQAPLAERHPRPGWVEQDPEAVWRSVQEAVGACVSPQLAGSVMAVGLSTQRESALVWDRQSGEPLTPALSWQDRRTADLAQAIADRGDAARVRRLSGLPLDPMFSALKIRWLLDAIDPDRSQSGAGRLCAGSIDSWIMSRFGGEPCIEAGNASRTQLLDIDAVAWSPELLEIFGVPEAALPSVRSSIGPFPAVKGLPPLPDGTPLLAVMADSHAALFGHGAQRPGEVKATHGTGASVMGLVDRDAALDAGVCRTIAWDLGQAAYAAEGNIRAAGATLRWVADLLGVSVEALADIARGADDRGVALVPAFNGLGAPWWDDQAVGLAANLTLGASRQALARAAFDSIGHQIADVVDSIERGQGPINHLFVDGGPTRNGDLMQAEADLIGRTLLRSDTAELSALGVVHLAGLQAGVWTAGQLAERRPPRAVFEPAIDAARRRAARDRWGDAVARARLRPAPSQGEGAQP